jgi:uncharacterized protein YdcH (DUF465 family)
MDFQQVACRAFDPQPATRIGRLTARSTTPMQLTPEELKAHLMQTDDGFRLLAQQHCEFKKQLESFSSRPYLSPEEQIEETRIKKLKLRLKDQMQEAMDRYRQQHQPV